jgi:hypothetical protein
MDYSTVNVQLVIAICESIFCNEIYAHFLCSFFIIMSPTKTIFNMFYKDAGSKHGITMSHSDILGRDYKLISHAESSTMELLPMAKRAKFSEHFLRASDKTGRA